MKFQLNEMSHMWTARKHVASSTARAYQSRMQGNRLLQGLTTTNRVKFPDNAWHSCPC